MAKESKKNIGKKGKKREKQRAEQSVEIPVQLYYILSLLVCAIAIYTLATLVSYIYSWSSDQNLLVDNIFNPTVQVQNQGGKVGVLYGELLISKLFGIGAFFIPLALFFISYYILKKRWIAVIRDIIVYLFLAILTSLLSSYICSFLPEDNAFGGGLGGSYGYYSNVWLTSMIGPFGAGIVIIASLIILLFVRYKLVSTKLMSWVNGGDEKKSDANMKVNETADGEGKASEILEDDSNLGEDENSKLKDEQEQEDDDIYEEEEDENDDDEREEDDDEDEDEEEADDDDDEGKEDNSANKNQSEGELIVEDGVGDTIPIDEIDNLFDPRLDLSSYEAPSMELLSAYKEKCFEVSRAELESNKTKIVNALKNFKIGVKRITAKVGPTVTLYEVVPIDGVRVAAIKKLSEDLQLSLRARGLRVVQLVGSDAVGIEVANAKPSIVSLLSLLEDKSFNEKDYELPIAMGRTITNEVLHFDLAKMPHLLIAGATGQGKSVGLNILLASLLYKKHPAELKLVLVDPKRVEFSLYKGLAKHFLAQIPDVPAPIITDVENVKNTLKSLCIEMDERYVLLEKARVRKITEYNQKFLARKLNPNNGHRFMPYIVVVIDEYADLLMQAGKEIEEPITRLAQLARAIGIHLVIATQRPTTTIITGTIKANFPSRIAFMVRSGVDSRTILDVVGANQLIGKGDMLFSDSGDLIRAQCAYIDTDEVEAIVESINAQRGYANPYFLPEVIDENGEGSLANAGIVDLTNRDPLFEEAARLVVVNEQGSTSLIQRKMNIGYNRAGRIMDQLEVAGIVGPYEGSKARQVLITIDQIDSKLQNIKDIYGG